MMLHIPYIASVSQESITRAVSQLQVTARGIWQRIQDAEIRSKSVQTWQNMHIWIEAHPKIAGACFASIVWVILFILWRNNFKYKIKKDSEAAWMYGYMAAYDECDQALHASF